MDQLGTFLSERMTRQGLSRRGWLTFAGMLTSIPLLGRAASGESNPKFLSRPFTLGVASGDPDASGFVLWTRLAPEPLAVGAGMQDREVAVGWEVATDDTMKTVVASGVSNASPSLGHSVHVEVEGLEPDRWYWYRFTAGDELSPIGRSRTLPLPSSAPKELKFAFASCQNYEQGYFTAYRQMAEDDLDLIVHLGDYIYEYASGVNGNVRTHLGGELNSLDDYRIRYSQYRSDPLLQAAHASCPWLVTWDDHEFDNNCADDISEEFGVDPVDYLIRRANAYQAYYEMMPLRASSLPAGSDMQLYRKASFGNLAEFLVLDTRQYRTDQPNGDGGAPLNAAAMATSQSLLGATQRNWLYKGLLDSDATWNILAQQVMMGLVNRSANPQLPLYSMDQWPGYAAERRHMLEFMNTRKISNPIVLTGDIHSNWANELRLDDRQAEQPLVATEFVTTSISSGGNGQAAPRYLQQLKGLNPCVKFHNTERGYVRCRVTPQEWTSEYMAVDDVHRPGGSIQVRETLVVESGDPAIQSA